MTELSTTYMGEKLRNPIIAGASSLTSNIDKIKHLEEAGAGAIVIKSLFEEQIQLESLKFEEDLHKYDNLTAEMTSLFPKMEHGGPAEHLMWVKKAKEAVKIPVFASLNAVSRDTWIDYAQKLADTGVDGLELNFFATPTRFDTSAADIEIEQQEILNEIKVHVPLPIAVKLSPFYTNPLNFIHKLDQNGVNAFVLFNQLFQPDINPELQKNVIPFTLSDKKDYRLPLRYAALLSENIQGNVCASSGISEGRDVVKLLLAGADSVQVVSTLYRNGIDHLKTMLTDLEKWMDEKGYKSIADFKGKLNKNNSADPWAYKRGQYVNLLMKGNPLVS